MRVVVVLDDIVREADGHRGRVVQLDPVARNPAVRLNLVDLDARSGGRMLDAKPDRQVAAADEADVARGIDRFELGRVRDEIDVDGTQLNAGLDYAHPVEQIAVDMARSRQPVHGVELAGLIHRDSAGYRGSGRGEPLDRRAGDAGTVRHPARTPPRRAR